MFERRTRPGTVLGSRGFEIMFVAGHKVEVGSYIVEYETDWTALMEIVLAKFEEGNNLVNNIHACLNNIIFTKVVLNDAAGKKVTVEADISDENYFLSKQTRSLYIRIFDGGLTSLHFFIRRKQILRSLKDLALHKVANSLKDESKIAELEIPRTLRQEVGEVLEHWWIQRSRADHRLEIIQPRMMARDVSWRAAHFVENVNHD